MGQDFEEERKSPKNEDNDIEDKFFAIPLLFGTTTQQFFLFLHQSED